MVFSPNSRLMEFQVELSDVFYHFTKIDVFRLFCMRSLEYPVIKSGACLGRIRGPMVLPRYINDLLDNDICFYILNVML